MSKNNKNIDIDRDSYATLTLTSDCEKLHVFSFVFDKTSGDKHIDLEMLSIGKKHPINWDNSVWLKGLEKAIRKGKKKSEMYKQFKLDCKAANVNFKFAKRFFIRACDNVANFNRLHRASVLVDSVLSDYSKQHDN